MDFKALAMESESLLSHIARPDGIPRLTKSLAEIVRHCIHTPASNAMSLNEKDKAEYLPRIYSSASHVEGVTSGEF